MAAQLEGVADLTAALNQVGVTFAAKGLRSTVHGALELVEHRARARMPQGTEPHKTWRGRLVSPGFALSTLHIESGFSKRTGTAFALLGVGREAFYVLQFVELGTRFHAAQPWLRPAFEFSAADVLRELGVVLKVQLEKATARSRARARQRARFY